MAKYSISNTTQQLTPFIKTKNKKGMKNIKVSIKKSGSGEPFHFKPVECGIFESFSEVRWHSHDNKDRSDIYHINHYLLPLEVNFFWLWFVISIKIKRDLQSKMFVKRIEEPITPTQELSKYTIDDLMNQKPL